MYVRFSHNVNLDFTLLQPQNIQPNSHPPPPPNYLLIPNILSPPQNYLSEALVQYTVDLLVSRPSEVPEARVSMLAVIASIAASPLPKYDITAALDVIMTHKSLNLDTEDYYKKPLLVMALDLLSVGYLHRPLIDVLTSPDTLSMFMSRYSKDDVNQRRLLEVDQALGEVFSSPHRVPHTFLEPGRRFIANQAPSRSTLRAMLNQILPDTDCLASGVVTEGGTYIDHLLVLDGEGVPIKLRNMDPPLTRNPTITSLNLPPEATRWVKGGALLGGGASW
ncbi:hypothetical protein GWK47_028062 [Chionoecetes opilio]|uniref:Uncharacterized protein n=1 Tax=Chionoecetes opilio TaxID=41210 RepID=A0A8J5D688_CHIOP|nr:hypothetical protein GWK47_028062 [Chionoecetes opilio]